MSVKDHKEQNHNGDPHSSPLNEDHFDWGNNTSTQYNHQFTTAYDREFHARMGKFFALSPASIAGAYFDWATHISMSPGKQLQLIESAWRKNASLFDYTFWSALGIDTDCCIDPLQQDRRFSNKEWKIFPFSVYQ